MVPRLPHLTAALVCLALVAASRAEVDETGRALAALTETYGRSLVKLVHEVEVRLDGMGALGAMLGAGGGGTTRTEVTGICVGPSIVVAPLFADADSGAGLLGGLLGSLGGEKPKIEMAGEIHAELADGTEIALEVLERDEATGVAVYSLGVDAGLVPVTFPKAPRPALGEPIVVLAPLAAGYTRSITWMQARIAAIREAPVRCYATDVPLPHPGALVVNLAGAPIGLLLTEESEAGVTALPGLVPTPSVVTHLYPADHLAELLARHPQKAEASAVAPQRPWLGANLAALGADAAKALGLARPAAVSVVRVYPGMPAALAGLVEEDLITGVDGQPLESSTELDALAYLRAVIDQRQIGETVVLSIWHRGETREVRVVLQARPLSPDAAPTAEDKVLGLVVRALTFEDRVDGHLDESLAGVVVKRLEPGGCAERALLHKGDLVLEIAGTRTPDVEAFSSVLAKLKAARPEKIIFWVRQRQDTKYLELQPQWPQDDTREF